MPEESQKLPCGAFGSACSNRIPFFFRIIISCVPDYMIRAVFPQTIKTRMDEYVRRCV